MRCIVLFEAEESRLYEERITVWRAESFEEAVELAEREARDYAQLLHGASWAGLAQAFRLSAEDITDGSEVFSLIRASELPPDEYLTRFFDTGEERQGSSG